MRYLLAAPLVLVLVVQAPRAQALPPVVTWCVSSPGALDLCSPDQDRVLASVRKRLAGDVWSIGEKLSIERVQ